MTSSPLEEATPSQKSPQKPWLRRTGLGRNWPATWQGLLLYLLFGTALLLSVIFFQRAATVTGAVLGIGLPLGSFFVVLAYYSSRL